MDAAGTIFTGMLVLSLVVSCGCTGITDTFLKRTAVTTVATEMPQPVVITPDLPDPTAATPVPTTVICIPEWYCSNWSSCSESGLAVRNCSDKYSCGTSAGRPATSKVCTYTPTLPPKGPYRIVITGGESCRNTAKNALTILEQRASPSYEFVRKYVGAINCSYEDMCYASGYANGDSPFYTVCIASLENPPTVYIDKPFWNSDPVWLAGVLVHEACHSEGYQEYILKEGSGYDPAEFSGWKFERRCCDRMRSTYNQLGVPELTNNLYRECSL